MGTSETQTGGAPGGAPRTPAARPAPGEHPEPAGRPKVVPTPDRWRYARHLDRLAAAGEDGVAGEARAVAAVLRDPDPVMAQSAVVTHLDRRAVRLLPGTGFRDWARALHSVLEGHAFPARRLSEWTLLKAIAGGGTWSPAELAAASDWCQRTAVRSPAPDEALALLAASARTRPVRNAAARRLHRRGSL
ncbi:hypothetical protein WDV06_34185 [Streptomyces racemochromogenes]|uniref:Uncharacterized protein n=1 Tax=Streptomyces racemochromogenes TaxID=67353 RepID=A0ABW7PNV6_9ACTN